MIRRLPARLDGTHALLAALLVLALALRLWPIDHGLPFVFNPDEELHFVPRAVGIFGGSLNPGYFENPSALTYLLHALFRVRFAEGFPFGSSGFATAFRDDPESAYLTARVAVALIGTAVVGLAYWAGARYFDRRVGLVAAAILTFAFLPVFYSRHALNDVVTLAPVALALVAVLVALERGTPWSWLASGGVVGLATATKYTAGAMLVTVGIAAAVRLRDRRDTPRQALTGLALAGAAFAVVFIALNPFALIDFSEFRRQVGGQAGTAGELAKLGQDDVPGWIYYGWTLTWGLGYVPAVAAVAGAALALRRDWRRGLLLVVFPVLFFLFLGSQARFFGRWLLPAYPALALLAAYAAVRAADLVPRRAWRPAVLAALAVALVGQGLFSSVRSASVLGREDTRSLARKWLVANVPAGSGVAVEPFIPQGFLTIGGREDQERYRRFPVKRPFQAYEKKLTPGRVDRYLREGYCWVVTASTQKGRGLKAGLRPAAAYYARLAGESDRTVVFSPFRVGTDPVEFNFDLSFNYQPSAYSRPGPVVQIHHLRGCADR